MPTMKSETIGKWSEQLRLGIKYKEDYGQSKQWPIYRNYYRGIFANYDHSSGGTLPYNITYGMARILIPNIYFRNPYITITPRWQMGSPIRLDMHAKMLEAIDNWLVQEIGLKQQIKTALLDCYFTNRAIWKIGYDSLYGFSEKHTEPALGLSDTSLTQTDKKGRAIEYNINVKPGMPWALWSSSDDIIVPFGVRTLDEAPWIAHRVLRPLEDMKADPKYANAKDLNGTHTESLSNNAGRGAFYKDMTSLGEWVQFYEIRDRKKKEVFAMLLDGSDYLRKPEDDLLQIEGLPYVDMTFNEDVEYYWGPSDCQIIEPQQLELNEARTQAMHHRRIALVKFLYNKHKIDGTEVEKMLSENVGPGVECKDDPGPAVAMLQPHIPAELIGWVDQIRADVREMLGFSRQAMGETPPGRRTAAEVGIAEQARQIRMDERRDMVADAYQHVVRKINQVIFDRWDTNHVVQVVGYDGARYWVEFTKQAIIGEYNTKVDVESMTPTTKALKKKEVMEVIGMLSKHPRANIDLLMKMLLREYDWMDAMAILPEAPEMQGGEAMPVNDYMGLQNKMLGDQGFRQGRVKQTQAGLGAIGRG